MKTKITKKTGEVIELEGTSKEIAEVIKESLKLDQESLPNYWGKEYWLGQSYCLHEYPFPWYGVNPASCKKCGYTPPNYSWTLPFPGSVAITNEAIPSIACVQASN